MMPIPQPVDPPMDRDIPFDIALIAPPRRPSSNESDAGWRWEILTIGLVLLVLFAIGLVSVIRRRRQVVASIHDDFALFRKRLDQSRTGPSVSRDDWSEMRRLTRHWASDCLGEPVSGMTTREIIDRLFAAEISPRRAAQCERWLQIADEALFDPRTQVSQETLTTWVSEFDEAIAHTGNETQEPN